MDKLGQSIVVMTGSVIGAAFGAVAGILLGPQGDPGSRVEVAEEQGRFLAVGSALGGVLGAGLTAAIVANNSAPPTAASQIPPGTGALPLRR